MLRYFDGVIIITLMLALLMPAHATEYSSTNYKLLDPQIQVGSGTSSSSSYQIVGTLGELALGRSTTASYTFQAGSAAFPTATAPSLSATAGQEQATLSWSASQGSLGWTVSSYDVCTGTQTNTYTSCQDVGNVVSFVKSGLTPSTPYFFQVRPKDVFGTVIARSNEATATPTQKAGVAPAVLSAGAGGAAVGQVTFPVSLVTPTPSPPPSPTRGEEAPAPAPPAPAPTVEIKLPEAPPKTNVVMRGRAYPGVEVSLLKNGAIVKKVSASREALFEGAIPDLSDGIYTFGVQAKDKASRRSILLTFTLNVPKGVSTLAIDGIFLPPTIDLSSDAVKQGEPLDIFGQTFPGSNVTIRVTSTEVLRTVVADKIGAWLFTLDTKPLEEGTHLARSKSKVAQEESTFGEVRSFVISQAPKEETKKCKGADLNLDGAVGTADVSIVLFYWNQAKPENICADLNSDGKVNLTDLSILLYYWSG